jgi:hypothetical protein
MLVAVAVAVIYAFLFTSLFTPLLMSLPIVLPKSPLTDSGMMYARARASRDPTLASALTPASLPMPLLVFPRVVNSTYHFACVSTFALACASACSSC